MGYSIRVIKEMVDPQAVLFEGYDEAIVGVDTKGRLVYDLEALIDTLIKDNAWDEEEALEWFWFHMDNMAGGDHGPVIIKNWVAPNIQKMEGHA